MGAWHRWTGWLALAVAAPAMAQNSAPQHTQPPPFLATTPAPELARLADLGVEIDRGRPAADALAEHRKLDRALAAIGPQRRGVVDAYVVSVALDSDPVFGREAREAGRVLTRRYAAAGHSVVLGGTDGRAASDLPRGSPGNLAAVLARVAEQMDRSEDVLVLYTTSHGAPLGIVYNDGDLGFGAISPARLWSLLTALGIRNRLVLVSACYSGAFVPILASPSTAIVTASSADRTSFGCQSDNDWTFFGDALVNHALRSPVALAAAAEEATRTIGGWEASAALTPSQPQVSIGSEAAAWLAILERRLPPADASVGRPATAALPDVSRSGR
jgi:hypothetical protein